MPPTYRLQQKWIALKPGLGRGAAEVGIVLGFDVDSLTDVDKERHLNHEASLHGGGLVHIVGGVALDALR